VALGGKVDHCVDPVFAERRRDLIEIAYVALFEKIALSAEFPGNIRQAHKIAGVGQRVVIDDGAGKIRSSQDMTDEIGTDKLPDGISDISGKIYGKFDFIVGWLENNEPRYESIIEKEVGDEI